MNNCKICNKETTKTFCSLDCYYVHRRSIKHELVCETCGKSFFTNNAAYVRLKRLRHCSQQCKSRKHSCNEDYFKGVLTNEKLITLGQIIACGQLEGINEIKIFSNIETLQDIQKKLNSDYEISKSERGLYRIDIKSQRLVSDLIDLGLTYNKLTQEVPRDDLWEGLKSTHCYEEKDNICIFTTESSKISRWVEDKFSTEVSTKTWRFKYKLTTGIFFINTWVKK